MNADYVCLIIFQKLCVTVDVIAATTISIWNTTGTMMAAAIATDVISNMMTRTRTIIILACITNTSIRTIIIIIIIINIINIINIITIITFTITIASVQVSPMMDWRPITSFGCSPASSAIV